MWSPQQYLAKGRQLGRNEQLLQAAVEQANFLAINSPGLPPILTLGHLAARTKTSPFQLRQFVSGYGAYEHFRVRKRLGGHRVISVPEPSLMHVQRWISQHVLKPLTPHRASYAFAKDSSIVKCARMHVGAKWLVKMDVTAFFGSISTIQAYRVFKRIGYQPLVAFELARISTYAPSKSARYDSVVWKGGGRDYQIGEYRSSRLGYLPQGAPTSPMLSNLVMYSVDELLSTLAAENGLIYTRYADDITFSTISEYSREKAKNIVWAVTKIMAKVGLRVNPRKTKIVPPGGRKVVLGLLVDGPSPRLTRTFRANLRQHLYFLETRGALAHAQARGFSSLGGMYRHLRGLIDHANAVEPDYAASLLLRLDAINWLSSPP